MNVKDLLERTAQLPDETPLRFYDDAEFGVESIVVLDSMDQVILCGSDSVDAILDLGDFRREAMEASLFYNIVDEEMNSYVRDLKIESVDGTNVVFLVSE